MIRIGANGNKITYGIKHYILDTEADFSSLPSSKESMGTTCFVIENSKWYMVNGALKWIEIKNFGNSSGDNGSGDGDDNDENPSIPDEEIVYDGGDI